MAGRAEEGGMKVVEGTRVEGVVVGRRDLVSGALLRKPLPLSIPLLKVGVLGGREVLEDPFRLLLPIFSPLLGSLSLHCGTC